MVSRSSSCPWMSPTMVTCKAQPTQAYTHAFHPWHRSTASSTAPSPLAPSLQPAVQPHLANDRHVVHAAALREDGTAFLRVTRDEGRVATVMKTKQKRTARWE